MKALIIGSGSIGERHANNLLSMGFEVDVLSRNKSKKFRSEVLEISNKARKIESEDIDELYEIAVLATPSSIREQALANKKIGTIKNLYVEVPAAVSSKELKAVIDYTTSKNIKIGFGYNIRFHPGIIEVISTIKEQPKFLRSIFGEHLPSHIYGNLIQKDMKHVKI